MRRTVVPRQRPSREKTKLAIHDALAEMQHAARPKAHGVRNLFSWLIALSAGATVAWRSFQAAQQANADGDNATPTGDACARVNTDTVFIETSSSETSSSATAPTARPAAALTSPSSPHSRSTEPFAPTDKSTEPPAPTDRAAGIERETVQGVIGLAKEFLKRFTDDEGPTRAAALAFVGVLTLVPLLLIALAALGFLIPDPNQAASYVKQFVAQMLPGQRAAQAANDLIQQTHIVESARTLMHGKWWAVVFGVLSLAWSAVSLFVTASAPMNAAWEVKETRGFLQLRLVCLGVFVGAGLLFVLSLLPSSGPNFIRNLHIPWLNLPQPAPFWLDALFELLAWAIDIGMFVLIYRFLPNAPVTWKAAAFGGVIAGFLWEIFKKGFAIYLAHFGNFDKFYGALGGVFLLITWIYYSCIVLLAGAILSKMYHEHKEEGGVVRRASSESPERQSSVPQSSSLAQAGV